MPRTRQEHMDWCKERANQYIDNDDFTTAYSSMASDLLSHPETADHIGIKLGMVQMMSGQLGTEDEMRKFINGFA